MEGRKPFYIVMTIFIVQSQFTAFYYPHTTSELLVLLTLPLMLLGVLLKTIRGQKIAITGAVALVVLIAASTFITQT
jgi:multidrug efflux pump subunit AcrB